MKLHSKKSDDVVDAVLDIDPGGLGPPRICAPDGHDLGEIEAILQDYHLSDLSSVEEETLRSWSQLRDLVERSEYLERYVHEVDEALGRLRLESDAIADHASMVGFHLQGGTGIPGAMQPESIVVERWNWLAPERRSAIIRALLIAIDCRRKMREWTWDPVSVRVVRPDGGLLEKAQLREGYNGPIA